MEFTKTYKIIFGIIAVVVLGFITSAFIIQSKKEKDDTKSTLQATTTTAIGESMQVTTPTGDTYTITPVPIQERKAVAIPNLDRPVTLFAGAIIAPEAKTVSIEKVKATQTLLKKNTGNLSAWIDLGIYQKMGGDYEGAILSWKYVSLVGEKPFVALGNLGNLYAYFMKDMINAEKYYNEAIKNAPTQIYLYVQLAEAFRDISKNTVKARAVIERGLVANPNNPSLIEFKATLN